MTLDQTIATLIKIEGGYVDHKNDKGGPTNWGITEQVARAYGYTGPMQAMPVEVAQQIYKERYWFAPKFDQINIRSTELAEEMLDTGVNMGVNWPGKFLQRSLNLLNKQATKYPDITVDGNIGKMTLWTLDQLIAFRGPKICRTVTKMCNHMQANRYFEIAEKNPTQEDFIMGWIDNRT